MATQRKYEMADFREAIDQAGAEVRLIASYLGCTRSTVYRYLKDAGLRAYYEMRQGAAIQERAQYTREMLIEAIRESRGVKATVAARLGCSRQTVNNKLDEWPELAEMLDAERSWLIDKAVSALVTDVETAKNEGHQRAYMFVLRTLAKDEGFSERTELTGADGQDLIPDEMVKLAGELGLDLKEVMRHMANMMRAQAAQRGLGDG
jgi:AcrR family transcriptional regulator